MFEIFFVIVLIGGYILYKLGQQDGDLKLTTTIIKPKQTKEEQEKYEEALKRSKYERIFREQHDTLLKVIFYIVKADSTFNKKEKIIVKEFFAELENHNPYLTDRFLEYVYRKLKITSIQSFKLNVNKLLKSNEYNLNLLDFSKKIINTQKTIHPAEQEILDYLEKKYITKDIDKVVEAVTPYVNQGEK